MIILHAITAFFKIFFASRASLAAENIALRHQLAILKRSVKRPRLRKRDRIFWSWLSRLWTGWRSALIIVQPETVIRWHRQGFRLYWRWKSRGKAGRPKVSRELREMIRRMSKENPTWGAPRILSELLLLGYDVVESTVSKYMVRPRKPPSQTWLVFLKNHMHQIVAIDFFTIHTITFRIIYCFIVICHHRREVVHFNVTPNPSAEWAARQIVQASPYDSKPRFLLRDRDDIYGGVFRQCVHNMGIKEIVTAHKSPWQNPYAERLIGSIRRDGLDHVVVLNENHLRKTLSEYFRYYNNARAHLSLDRNSPIHRRVFCPSEGSIASTSYLGGLHHRYTRAA